MFQRHKLGLHQDGVDSGGRLLQVRQGDHLSSVRGVDQVQDRGLGGGLPQVDGGRQAAHVRGDRQCPLCLPTSG